MLEKFSTLFIQRVCHVEIENDQKDKVKVQKANIPDVRRNQSCPCGSGKKYKHCHGTKSIETI
jgi:uncharacterized protein YecA (UPF0149 family)